MPQPYKGRRVRATVRLPYNVAETAARHAARNGWSMSQYIAWCVERMNDKRTGLVPTPPESHGAADGVDRIGGEAVSLAEMIATLPAQDDELFAETYDIPMAHL